MMAERHAGASCCRSQVAVIYDNGAIDDDVINARRLVKRVLVVRRIGDLVGVENDNVRPAPLAQKAAIRRREYLRGFAGCFMNRLGNGQYLLLSDVDSEDAGEGATPARVRLVCGTGVADGAVTAKHTIGCGDDLLDVGFAHIAID